MEIGEVLTCRGLTVLFITCWCQQKLPNDRRNTEREIMLSSSDDDNDYCMQSNHVFWYFSKHASSYG